MDKKTIDFVETMAAFTMQIGMSRSVSRILAFLLMCEPPYKTADQIQKALEMSAGSVSTALAALQQATLVDRRTFPGDRHYYYGMSPKSWKALTLRQLEGMSRGAELAQEGLTISPGNERLMAVRDLYAVYASVVEDVKKRIK